MFIRSPSQNDSFEQVTSVDALFEAWETFRKGKTWRRDVQTFWRRLEGNLFGLHRQLVSGSYRHGSYESFFINDPKPRHIRKAQVRDRIVHQALHSALSRVWEPVLIHDAYSARIGKGTHFGVNRVWGMIRRESKNFTTSCWALKCDIRKLYDSIDHSILMELIQRRIADQRVVRLVGEIVSSFHTEGAVGKGIPIGNVTSQVFTNIYLSELDYSIKQVLRVKCYGRFSDDFVLISRDRSDLLVWRKQVEEFLRLRLQLLLHPHKVVLQPLHQGIDFLGYVLLPHHRVLRTTTRRRMFRRLERGASAVVDGVRSKETLRQSLASYQGMLLHADTFALRRLVLNAFGTGNG